MYTRASDGSLKNDIDYMQGYADAVQEMYEFAVRRMTKEAILPLSALIDQLADMKEKNSQQDLGLG